MKRSVFLELLACRSFVWSRNGPHNQHKSERPERIDSFDGLSDTGLRLHEGLSQEKKDRYHVASWEREIAKHIQCHFFLKELCM